MNVLKNFLKSDKNQDLPIIVVGISGASGSGKSTVAESLVEEIKSISQKSSSKSNPAIRVKHIFGDMYFKALYGNLSVRVESDEQAKENFKMEHPNNVDFERMEKDVCDLIEQRRQHHSDCIHIILIESFVLFNAHESLLNLLNLKFFLNTSKQLCSQRRLNRNPYRNKDPSFNANIYLENYLKFVWQSFENNHEFILKNIDKKELENFNDNVNETKQNNNDNNSNNEEYKTKIKTILCQRNERNFEKNENNDNEKKMIELEIQVIECKENTKIEEIKQLMLNEILKLI